MRDGVGGVGWVIAKHSATNLLQHTAQHSMCQLVVTAQGSTAQHSTWMREDCTGASVPVGVLTVRICTLRDGVMNYVCAGVKANHKTTDPLQDTAQHGTSQ